MKSHTELSKIPLPIPTVACKLHYWTSNEHQCQIPDDNISARSYHEKAPKKQEGGQKGQNIRHGQYYSVKQNFVTSSGGSWILPNKRPDHLRDSLKEMEETLKSQSVLHVRWIKRNRMQIILHTGLLINILLSDTYDIQKIVFDKSLIGKISQDGGAISSAFLSRQFCLLSFTDKNKLGFASFTQRPGTPDHKQVSNKISSMDMKISFHDIPGTPNRKSEKKFCVNKLEDKAVCWCPSYKGPNSWTPTSTDKERANMILLGCSFGRLEVLNYVQTECDPLSVDFSNLNPYQIHTLEKSVNVRKESFLHYTVYECLQNKIQRLNVSTLPLKSGLLSSARNKTEDKVVIGCTDGTLIVYNIITKAIVQVRESLVPSVVSWHPNGGIVMVASGSAELRCYDTSLSPLTTVLIGDLFSGMPGSSLKLSQFLTAGNGLVSLSWLDPSKDESSDNHGVVQQTKLNPAHDVALVLFDGGPLAILKLNLGVINKGLLRPLDIIKEYLSHRNVTPAIQVLNNINWNTDGHQAFHGLISIINHLLKLPLNHERENQLEGTLATFYAPSSPLSESVVVQYRHAISRYARKFFFHLLRFGRYEKSFLLAQDIQAQDLFVDLHFAAKEVGENRIARAAKERAYDLQSSGSSEGEDEDSYSDDDDHINMQARILQESRQDGGVRQSRKGARSQGDRSKDRRDKDKLKRTVPPSYPPPKMNNFMTALMNEARAVVQENSGAQEDEDQDDAAGKSSSSLKVMHLGYV